MERSNFCLEGEWLRLWSELTCGWGEVTGGDRIPTTSRVGKTTGLPSAKIDQDFMQCYCLHSWVSSQPPAWAAGKICPKHKTFTWKQIACNPYLGLCLASAWPLLGLCLALKKLHFSFTPVRPSFPYLIFTPLTSCRYWQTTPNNGQGEHRGLQKSAVLSFLYQLVHKRTFRFIR